MHPLSEDYLLLHLLSHHQLYHHLHLENHRQGEKIFDATLSLSERELTPASLNGILWRFPFMTARVGLAIYWQALRLFLKRTPFYSHPRTKDSGVLNE